MGMDLRGFLHHKRLTRMVRRDEDLGGRLGCLPSEINMKAVKSLSISITVFWQGNRVISLLKYFLNPNNSNIFFIKTLFNGRINTCDGNPLIFTRMKSMISPLIAIEIFI